jgi:hypothetical protein
MKHLKKYESSKKDIEFVNNLKKYSILKYTNDLFEILELISFEDKEREFYENRSWEEKYATFLIKYNIEYGNLIKVLKKTRKSISYSDIKYRTIYTSDDLNDCLKEMELEISTKKKYNI